MIREVTLKKGNFVKFFDSPISSVTSFSIREITGNGFGAKFYINSSPYPIIIYNQDGTWSTNFYGEIDISKIAVCSANPRLNESDERIFQVIIESYG